MSTQHQTLVFVTLALTVLAFMFSALLQDRKNIRLLTQQKAFFQGKSKKKKQSFWQPLFLYKRRWTRMRTLLPKIRTTRPAFNLIPFMKNLRLL